MRGDDMKNKIQKARENLRPQYEFDYTKGVRGKYIKRLREEGSNIVVLESDVAKVFSDSASVNKALRSIIEIVRSTKGRVRKPSKGNKRESIKSRRT
jgi:hypothetical protein